MKLKVPLDIDERIFEQWQDVAPDGALIPDASVARLADAVKATRTNCGTLVGLADALAADRTTPSETSALKLRGHALAVAEKTAQRLDSAKEAVATEIENLSVAMGTPPLPGTPYAVSLEQEIRSRLCVLQEKERDAVIGKAFADKDTTILGAVLRGPPMLTGVSEPRHNMIREQYRRDFHPAEYARYGRLRGAMEAMERTGHVFVDFIGGIVNSETMNVAEASVAATKAAELAVQNVIAGKEPAHAG
ncbi:hypothetical protein [Rhizobium sp.]